MIGLGRMSSNITRRLLDGVHHFVVYDAIKEAVEDLRRDTEVEAGESSIMITGVKVIKIIEYRHRVDLIFTGWDFPDNLA